ncbi:MAG: M48 family metallopeptidase [Candidatus Ozemobacteraceae bacterium]
MHRQEPLMKMRNGMIALVLVLLLCLPVAAPASSFFDVLDKVGKALDVVNSAVTGAPLQTNVAPEKILPSTSSAPSAASAPTVSAATASAAGTTKKTLWDTLFGGVETKSEESMGAATHKSLSGKPGFSNNKAELDQLGRVARKLVPVCDRKDLTYRFSVLNTDEVNAFAAPGGYVYVTRGLLKMVSSDDELAGVLAHELGHVNCKHGIHQAEKAGLITLAVTLMGVNDKTKKAQGAATIAAYFANLQFSRTDEFEADRKAVDYTYKAGYKPDGLIKFFQKINKDSASANVTKFFSTHPPTNDRIKAANKEITLLTGKATNAPEALPAAGKAAASSQVAATSQAPTNAPIPDVPGIGSLPGSSGSSGQPVFSTSLQEATRRASQAKEHYNSLVAAGASIDLILDAHRSYSAAAATLVRMRDAGAR